MSRDDRLGNGWALVDLGDFKSLCRAMPSEVGSIPTHSRQPSIARRRVAPDITSPKFERRPLHIPRIVAVVTAALIAGVGGAMPVVRAAEAPADSASADSVAALAPDSLRAVVADDTLGIPGRLEGQTKPPDVHDPEQVKAMLQRMGSNEIEGRTAWERKKNPGVAMLCSAILPGLGQTYNGRRLKVGLMVGFTSFYFGNGWLSWKAHERSIAARDAAPPGSQTFARENENAEIYKQDARRFLWWSGAVWLIGILDSWIDAHLYDVREYTPPSRPQTSGLTESGTPGSYITVGFDLDFVK